MVAAVTLVMSLVLGLGFAGLYALGGPGVEGPVAPATPPTSDTVVTPVPTSPVATPAVEPSPEPSAMPSNPEPGADGPWQLPSREWEALPEPAPQGDVWAALQAVELRDEPSPILVGCPAIQTIETEAQYRELVRGQWQCVHAAWTPLFERQGWSTVEPGVEFYTGTGSASDCGYLEAPAFYCSAGSGTVHFGAGHMEMAMGWDLSINEMVNHEYAHHIQSLAGITAAKLALPQTNELERRAELQATCWSAAMTFSSEVVDFDQDDWDSWHERLQTMTIDGIHGSRESILYWGTRGLYAGSLGECATWAVDATMVS